MTAWDWTGLLVLAVVVAAVVVLAIGFVNDEMTAYRQRQALRRIEGQRQLDVLELRQAQRRAMRDMIEEAIKDRARQGDRTD